jgi:hypothetical protein
MFHACTLRHAALRFNIEITAGFTATQSLYLRDAPQLMHAKRRRGSDIAGTPQVFWFGRHVNNTDVHQYMRTF